MKYSLPKTMTNEEIAEYARKWSEFKKTDIGLLFCRFTTWHATAYSLNERSLWHEETKEHADAAWEALFEVEKEIHGKLMEFAGVK